MTLQGENLLLRALEPEDLSFIYTIENDESIWEISNTQTPYSRYIIKQYLENAHQDIYESKQLRLVICEKTTLLPLGLIDLFDFDPKNHRAGIGILIHNANNRNKGIGTEALQLLLKYSFKFLQLHQLYANISANNRASLKLFTNFGFQKIGVKKDWLFQNGSYHDEILFQYLNINN